jgi:energy-coupling factor transporter ATP-binding protein EcfA2
VRLTKFRATNFRSVIDSDWIDAESVTALIGVNESGKTNLLLPLWKLNPAREGEIKPTSDYPKANYAAVKANPGAFKFIEAEFAAPELAPKLAKLTGAPADVLDLLSLSRYFDGEYEISFPKHAPFDRVKSQSVTSIVEVAKKEIEAGTALQKEGSLKSELIRALDAVLASSRAATQLDAESLDAAVITMETALPETVAPTSSIVPRVRQAIEEIKELAASLRLPSPAEAEGVLELALQHLPKFVYYSNYGNLDSEIYLPHVVENLARADLGAKEAAKTRTLRVLFKFVQLQPKEILELGRDFKDPQEPGRRPNANEITAIATKKRERTILLNSAGTDLTKKFRDWWKQGDYTFEFQADGDHFRIWVSDSRRPEKVELEDRSTGLQWFLSFYLIFLVESTGDHQKAILLLDEPGLSLHPLAQRDLSAFFESLSSTNQILYTTHSPFLVDADMLDRARKVFVAPDGSTKASADLRRGSEDPRKAGATYAIYSALNMNVAESLLLGCQPVIVEGPSDQHYLATIKTLLIGSQLISPKREIVFPPSHGARNAKVVASILTGRDEVAPIMLLDGDEAGQKMARDLRNGAYQDAKDRIHLTDEFVQFGNSEIEDLFPVQFFAEAVDRWQRNAEQLFSDVVKSGQPIVPQIESWAATQNIELSEGWKVELARAVKGRALTLGSEKFPRETLDLWVKLFDVLDGPKI